MRVIAKGNCFVGQVLLRRGEEIDAPDDTVLRPGLLELCPDQEPRRIELRRDSQPRQAPRRTRAGTITWRSFRTSPRRRSRNLPRVGRFASGRVPRGGPWHGCGNERGEIRSRR